MSPIQYGRFSSDWTSVNWTSSTRGPASGVIHNSSWGLKPPPVTGLLSTIPLSSCKPDPDDGKYYLSNQDGYLNCNWIEKQPPRVGLVVNGADRKKKKHPLESCRLVVDTSFVAPQYKHVGDPLTSAPLDNPSASPRDQASALAIDVRASQLAAREALWARRIGLCQSSWRSSMQKWQKHARRAHA